MDWKNLQADVNMILNKHFTSGRSGYSINKVIVHYNAGDLSIAGCYSVWQTREASAHYQVESGGRIGQLVNDWDTAWHAGDWVANCTSIGIEHANKSDGTITEKCLDSGAHLVAAICHYYGLGRPEWLKNVFPHKYFQATSCPGQIYGSQKNAYMKRCQYWYDQMDGKDVEKPGYVGGSTSSGSSSSGSSSKLKAFTCNVKYGLRKLNGSWWPEVTNFNNSNDNGYAGAPHTKHDYLYIKVDKGSVKYRVKTAQDGWLPWVTKGNKKDLVNGCAGIGGHAITGVQIYYTTPDGYQYKQAWYRSQTTQRSGWLPVCCDDGTTFTQYDGWAGMDGEPLDRLQISISGSNPF